MRIEGEGEWVYVCKRRRAWLWALGVAVCMVRVRVWGSVGGWGGCRGGGCWWGVQARGRG